MKWRPLRVSDCDASSQLCSGFLYSTKLLINAKYWGNLRAGGPQLAARNLLDFFSVSNGRPESKIIWLVYRGPES